METEVKQMASPQEEMEKAKKQEAEAKAKSNSGSSSSSSSSSGGSASSAAQEAAYRKAANAQGKVNSGSSYPTYNKGGGLERPGLGYLFSNRPGDTSSSSDAVAAEKIMAKRVADHEWYMRNVKYKREYNKDYYEQNRNYWQKRYLQLKKQYADMNDDDPTKFFGTAGRQDYYVAKFNAARANREYDEFMALNAPIKLTDAWLTGAKEIIKSGGNFIRSLMNKRVNHRIDKANKRVGAPILLKTPD